MPREVTCLQSKDPLALTTAGYLDDKALMQKRERTLDTYLRHLDRYYLWCVEQGVPLDVKRHTPEVVRAYLRWVQERGVGQVTLRNHHVILRLFFAWCVEQEYISRSPMEKLRAPSLPKQQPVPFSTEELQALTMVMKGQTGERGLLRRAVVAVLLDTGLRAGELCGLRYEDADLMLGELRVVEGKGGKGRTVVLGSQGRAALQRYITEARRKHGEHGPLFVDRRGRPFTHAMLRYMLECLGREAGVSKVHPHRFRHHCAVTAVRAGMPLFQLQRLLGHSNLEMVRRYVLLSTQDLAAAMRDHSPLDHLNLQL